MTPALLGAPLGRQTMFAGLDDVDWASMHHAYGPATDLPDLLRGLLAGDAQAREIALDGLSGAVHHQGDVYDCTIACIPFPPASGGRRACAGSGRHPGPTGWHRRRRDR